MIAGVLAEQIVFDIAMLPADQRFARMLDEPVMFSAQGEVWVAAQYSRYARMAAAVAPQVLSVFPTLAELAEHGAIVRSLIVSELLGPVEIETVVTQMFESPPVPEVYDVPSDYRRVPPPPAQGFEAPQLISRVPANYPSEAAKAKMDGVGTVADYRSDRRLGPKPASPQRARVWPGRGSRQIRASVALQACSQERAAHR